MNDETEALLESIQASLETQMQLRQAVLYWQQRCRETHVNETRLHNELLAARRELRNESR